ncbi:hypothetical protein P5663_16270 [Priestia flexa]|uniref:hypothetical protein n=1 Tax=Priestia flexa TaxID=86664 RepID=UPI00240D0544|nr:hypothetical protein [Priestia flexa]WEZ07574.1 hypothetical protein P5663_16270 [Priestia flexa]
MKGLEVGDWFMHPENGVSQVQERNVYGVRTCQYYDGSGRIEFHPQEVYGSWKMSS